MTREEKIEWARELRTEGLTAPEIAERIGAPESTVRNWYLGGTCACGGPIDGSSKQAQKAPECANCVRQHRRNVERDERVRALWEEGVLTSEIARQLGLTAQLVRGIVRTNLRGRGIPVAYRRLPPETHERYKLLGELVCKGLSNAEIAVELGTSAESISTMITRARRLGWDIPHRSELA